MATKETEIDMRDRMKLKEVTDVTAKYSTLCITAFMNLRNDAANMQYEDEHYRLHLGKYNDEFTLKHLFIYNADERTQAGKFIVNVLKLKTKRRNGTLINGWNNQSFDLTNTEENVNVSTT